MRFARQNISVRQWQALYKVNVKEANNTLLFYIGFCLTGKIERCTRYERSGEEIAAFVYFGRQRVTSMLCSEHSDSNWCPHVVALMFYRMDYPEKVQYRLPVSDSVQLLSEIEQKQFINMLLAHHPLDLLAFAQNSLDDLLKMKDSNKVTSQSKALFDNSVVSVQDPTAGEAVDAEGVWSMDEEEVRRSSKKFFRKDIALGFSDSSDRYEEMSESWVYILRRSMASSDSSVLSIFGRYLNIDLLFKSI